jgi:hypothetical protein
MQAIITKYIGPTNTRGARYKATAAAASVTMTGTNVLTIAGNHMRAAEALVRKLGWDGQWIGGDSPDGTGYVFVCLSSDLDRAFYIE